jgi:hypothetical protein
MQYRLKNLKWLPVEKTAYTDSFVCYLLIKFPDFDIEGFYGKN